MSARVLPLVVLLLLQAAPAHAAPCPTVFPPGYAEELARDFPGLRVTAHVVDTRTGCEAALAPGLRITTASVVKAGVLAAVLLRAQDAGRGLTDGERARIRPMVQYSHNNPYVSDLYAAVGGVAGMDRLDRRVGAVHTTNTASYGATVTTARDRTRTTLALLHAGPLTAPYRAEAWRYTSTVHPTQRWGVSAGVPSGWQVALKNGFYPMRGNGWRVGSTGYVRGPDGRGYALTVMTDRGGSQVQGTALVERVSRRVAGALLDGAPAPRSVDRAHCTTTRSGQSWAEVGRLLGAAATDVQRVSGGNPSPLQGQRACAPDLR